MLLDSARSSGKKGTLSQLVFRGSLQKQGRGSRKTRSKEIRTPYGELQGMAWVALKFLGAENSKLNEPGLRPDLCKAS